MKNTNRLMVIVIVIPIILYCLSFVDLFSQLKITIDGVYTNSTVVTKTNYSIFERLISDYPSIIILVMGFYFIILGFDFAIFFIEVTNANMYVAVFNFLGIILFLFTYFFTYFHYCV